ncbi:MAG: VWA domain-containing protein [Planctomycetes bacterium]|nr:VWA domain-containing protein [Planctomycetota bacterium]
MTQSQGGRTHIAIILDRTGSMQIIRQDTIGGFNTFLGEQQTQPTPATLTLVQFDGQDPYEVIHKFTDINLVPKLTEETYVPRGNTPLYDAVGRGILDLKASLAAQPEALRPGKIVFVIVTDGHENASREFNGVQVKAMIAQMKEAGWQFVFLSADEKEVTDGMGLNIDRGYSMAVGKNAIGANHMWKRVSERLFDYRDDKAINMRMDETTPAKPTDKAPDAAARPPARKKR